MLHMYRSKPDEYISSLIGHEGKGSLIAYLRKKYVQSIIWYYRDLNTIKLQYNSFQVLGTLFFPESDEQKINVILFKYWFPEYIFLFLYPAICIRYSIFTKFSIKDFSSVCTNLALWAHIYDNVKKVKYTVKEWWLEHYVHSC